MLAKIADFKDFTSSFTDQDDKKEPPSEKEVKDTEVDERYGRWFNSPD